MTGIWRDDTISAETQSIVERTGIARLDRPPKLARSPRATGWDTAATTTDVPELNGLRATGAIIRDSWLRDPDGALVLRVAASDPDLVRRVLALFCLIGYASSPADTLTRTSLASRMDSPRITRTGYSRAGRRETWTTTVGPFAQLARVTDHLADFADTLPTGLLQLIPTITPAPRPVD